MGLGFFRTVLPLVICMVGGLAMANSQTDEVAANIHWAEQVFAEQPGGISSNQLIILHDDEQGTTKINLCCAGGALRLGDKTFSRGIGVNSNCTLRVRLDQPAAKLLATIGVDRNVDNTVASLRFHVKAGETALFDTEVMRPTGEVRPIDVPLKGAQVIDLIVDDGDGVRAFDQADWADAKIVLENGAELWLDDLARASGYGTDLPFSFVYGGKPSSELIGSWKRTVEDTVVDATQRRRTLTLTDPGTGLEVRAVCLIYTDTPGVDWTLHFTNTGQADTPVLEQVRAVDVKVWPGSAVKPPVLHRLRATGGADDWLPYDTDLPAGHKEEFAPGAGRSSMGACPFFNIEWPGGGVVTGIGWTGQWNASVEHADGALHVQAGMQTLHLALKPGESIRSPRIMQLYWTGDDSYAPYNLWRRTMLSHIVPKLDGQPVQPPICHMSTSFYEMDKGTAEDVLSYLKSIEGLGFEYFWLDAFRGKDVFPTIGNYVLPLEREIDLKRFPGGLQPIGEAVKKAGLKFVLWFEPERICPGTLMAQEHPEWVVLPGGTGWGLFNLGIPEAREYMTHYLNLAAKEYQMDCLRSDNAVFFSGLWAQVDQTAGPDRVGLAEIRYVEGLYQMWDDILAANPHLFIDNCSAGGHRIDLETCSRAIPLWRTDATIGPLMSKQFNQAALQNQVMNAGLSRFVPCNVTGMMGATPYLFRSGFNGGTSFAEDVRPVDYPREELKKAIIEGKRIRKFFIGDYYPLTEVTTDQRDWEVIQYHRPSQQDGLVTTFRRPDSPFVSYELRDLREIDPGADYEVTVSKGFVPEAPVRMKGSDLLKFTLAIPDCPGSVIVEYVRK